MINRIIAFSVENKLIVALMVFGLIGWGCYSATQLPIDAVPDITNNQVQVITTSESLAAQEIEQFITYPVELAMGNIPGVEEIRSISRFGLSVVTIVFEEDMGTFLPRQLVAEKLKEAEEIIGTGLGTPQMGPITTGLGEIYQYTLEQKEGSDVEYSATELRTINDWLVKRQLTMISGVVEISSWGGHMKQYEVAVDPAQLNSYDLTLKDIMDALEANNSNTGGSYIEKGSELYYIRGEGLMKGYEDIRETVVTNRNGIPIRIRDVAKVGEGQAPRYGAATNGGKGETVVGIVMMLKDANSNHVVERVKERVAAIQETLPEGLEIVPFLDRTRLVEKTMGTVSENLLLGGLIVIFALVFLLGTWRAGSIVASVIPLSMLFALGMMHVFGVSANLMSLGALDFGIIVDGAVIIVEFMVVMMVKRQAELAQLTGNAKQQKMDEITKTASSKMMNSAIFGQIIILIVFIPILSLTGIEGKMFKPMAMTFGFAITGAMLLCLTYVPMISSVLLKNADVAKRTMGDRFMEWMECRYRPVIDGALNSRKTVIFIALVFLIAALVVFLRMGGEFIPKLDEGDFAMETRMAPGTSLAEMTKNMTRLEKILLDSFPEVKSVVTKIGAGEIPTDPMPIEAADIMVVLKEKDEWVSADSKVELAEKMEETLSILAGVEVEFSQPIEMRFNELMTGVKQDIAVKIYGEDLDILQQQANVAGGIIRGIEGAADVKIEQVTGLPQLVITPNRKRLAEYGLSVDEVNEVVKTAFAGSSAGKVFEGEKRFDLVVRFQADQRQDPKQIEQLYISTPTGARIPLTEVASVNVVDAPAQISRDNTQRRIVIGVNVRNRDTEGLVKEIQQQLSNGLQLPAGYRVTYGGQFENLLKAKKRLSIAVPVALVLIFIILFISLRSLKQTMLIYTAIPFAAVGGVFALWIRGMPFSISAGVGFIALFGVAVLNGLILITSFNDLKEEGVTDLRERIRKAGTSRLRPIFLTAITDVLGFLPMAVSGSSGAEVQRPLATVVIGGLLTATLLTLVVLPVLYAWVESRKQRSNGAIVATLMFLFIIPMGSMAQNSEPITLEKAIEHTLQNNGSIKADDHRIESNRALQGSAFNPGKTSLGMQYGQYNSLENDIGFSVGQGFEFPTVYVKRSKLLKAQTEGAILEKDITASELSWRVSSLWNQHLILERKHDLLLGMDSVLARFKEAAQLRFEVGETNLLEKVAAETKLMEVRNELRKNDADRNSLKRKLTALMGMEADYSIVHDKELKRTLPNLSDSASLSTNPMLRLMQQQVAISENQMKLERSRMLPDLSIGYQNQSLRGDYVIDGSTRFLGTDHRFQSVTVGVSIPLWFRENTASIRSSKLQIDASKAEYEQSERDMLGELGSLMQELEKHRQSVAYYEQELLPQADLIMENVSMGFTQGELGYAEFMQGVQQATNIQDDHLNEVRLLNQTMIDLQLILGVK